MSGEYCGLSLVLRSKVWTPPETSAPGEEDQVHNKFDEAGCIESHELLEVPPLITGLANWKLTPHCTMLWHDTISEVTIDVFASKHGDKNKPGI